MRRSAFSGLDKTHLPFRSPFSTNHGKRAWLPESSLLRLSQRAIKQRQHSLEPLRPIFQKQCYSNLQESARHNPTSEAPDQLLVDLAKETQPKNPLTWVSLLEKFLHPSLRTQSDDTDEQDDKKFESPPKTELLALLKKGERGTGVNLLCFIGINQGRWEALVWLLSAMLQDCSFEPTPLTLPLPSPGVSRTMKTKTLDAYTSSPRTMTATPTLGSFESILGSEGAKESFLTKSIDHRILGYILVTLGRMVLQAEDRPKTNPIHGLAMSVVLRALGDMHHLDLLPSSIYNYEAMSERSNSTRPPTLFAMSQRIMSVLSDTAWKNHWQGEMEQAKAYGYELPPPKVELKVSFIGTEIWLDLILWICVEGNWILEGGKIVSDMETRRPNPSVQWSAISWDEICRTKRPQLGITELLKLQINRSRINQATGISIANSGVSVIEPGARHVSTEVIRAIADGLANILHLQSDDSGVRHDSSWDYLKSCRDLLSQQSIKVSRPDMMALMLRGFDISALGTAEGRRYAEWYLSLMPQLESAAQHDLKTVKSSSEGDVDRSAALLGLYLHFLDYFARTSDVTRSLIVIRYIQKLLDSNRQSRIDHFAENLKLLMSEINAPRTRNDLPRLSSALYARLPNRTVGALLDLMVDTQNFDLGSWLLFNDDADGGFANSAWFDELDLQPFILRYATASGDDRLQNLVLEKMRKHRTNSIAFHALLHVHIQQGNWDLVQESLAMFQTSQDLSWTSSDAMELAAFALKAESRWASEDWGSAMSILQDLLDGKYNGGRGDGPSHRVEQFRTANQLAKMLVSLRGPVGRIKRVVRVLEPRAQYPITIPSDAFRTLLQAVVTYRGPQAGISLWNLFVHRRQPAYQKDETFQAKDEDFTKVVEPTYSALRIIITRLLADSGLEGRQQMFGWALKVGRALGFDERDLLTAF